MVARLPRSARALGHEPDANVDGEGTREPSLTKERIVFRRRGSSIASLADYRDLRTYSPYSSEFIHECNRTYITLRLITRRRPWRPARRLTAAGLRAYALPTYVRTAYLSMDP
jgi:hypothetical protein